MKLHRSRALCLTVLAACGGASRVGKTDASAGDHDAGKQHAGDGDTGGDGDHGTGDGDASGNHDAGTEHDAGKPGGTPDVQSFVGLYENSHGMPIVSLIDAARAHVDIAIYELLDLGVQKAISRALKRGVSVRVIAEPEPVDDNCNAFEPIGASESNGCYGFKKLITDIRAAGGSAVPFAKNALCDDPSRCLLHGKMLLVDSKVALVSTGNFNGTSLCDPAESVSQCDRDYTVISDDALVVDTLQRIFEKDLAGSAYDLQSMLTTDVTKKLTVSPYSRAPLVDFINSAKKSIQLQNQYLHEPEINDALAAAAQRGVKVQVMVASFCAFGRPSNSERNQETSVFQAFDSAGVEGRAFTSSQNVGKKPGYLHAKAMVVDDRGWVGSVNGSTQATSQNREFGLFFDDPAWVKTLRDSIASDFADPDSETWQESLSCTKDN